jgi:hypothetical protein
MEQAIPDFVTTSPTRSNRLAPKLKPTSGNIPIPIPTQGITMKLKERKRTPSTASGNKPKDVAVLLTITMTKAPPAVWAIEEIPMRYISANIFGLGRK